MKNVLVIASVAFFAFGCAGNAVMLRSVDSKSMAHFSQLKGEMAKPENIGSQVFYLNEGDTIPLLVTVKTNVVDSVNEKIPLTVRQKTYFMIDVPKGSGGESKEKLLKQMKIYVSNDAAHWVPILNMKALKKMFGWKKGFITVGFGISKEEGMIANIGVGTTGGGKDAPSTAPGAGGSVDPASGEPPGKTQPPETTAATAEEMRKCDTADDCVPVGCKCDCSGCGGFSSEDIVNKKYEDAWYQNHKCEKLQLCLEVCCQPRTIVCENNVCGSKAP